MHTSPEYGLGTLRLTFGRHTTVHELDKAVPILVDTVRKAWKDKSVKN